MPQSESCRRRGCSKHVETDLKCRAYDDLQSLQPTMALGHFNPPIPLALLELLVLLVLLSSLALVLAITVTEAKNVRDRPLSALRRNVWMIGHADDDRWGTSTVRTQHGSSLQGGFSGRGLDSNCHVRSQ